MKIENNKCSNCGYDGVGGWLLSNPVKCPQGYNQVLEDLLQKI